MSMILKMYSLLSFLEKNTTTELKFAPEPNFDQK